MFALLLRTIDHAREWLCVRKIGKSGRPVSRSLPNALYLRPSAVRHQFPFLGSGAFFSADRKQRNNGHKQNVLRWLQLELCLSPTALLLLCQIKNHTVTCSISRWNGSLGTVHFIQFEEKEPPRSSLKMSARCTCWLLMTSSHLESPIGA